MATSVPLEVLLRGRRTWVSQDTLPCLSEGSGDSPCPPFCSPGATKVEPNPSLICAEFTWSPPQLETKPKTGGHPNENWDKSECLVIPQRLRASQPRYLVGDLYEGVAGGVGIHVHGSEEPWLGRQHVQVTQSLQVVPGVGTRSSARAGNDPKHPVPAPHPNTARVAMVLVINRAGLNGAEPKVIKGHKWTDLP